VVQPLAQGSRRAQPEASAGPAARGAARGAGPRWRLRRALEERDHHTDSRTEERQLNFSELKTELYARGTDYLSEDGAGVARAELWLNQGYREILNLQVWPFLVASQSGATPLVITDLRRIQNAWYGTTSDSPLQVVSQAELLEDGLDLTDTGTPVYIYADTTGLKTYPVTTGSITVIYIKRVNPLTGTDTPIFDEEYHPLIVDKAMIRAYIDGDNYEAAAGLKQLLDENLAAMTEDYMLTSRGPRYIQVVDPYDG
jgi:hypothetical protein